MICRLFDNRKDLRLFHSNFCEMIFQHPLMPPYGTPVPYPALYPPAGVYAHPSMATVINISFQLFNILLLSFDKA